MGDYAEQQYNVHVVLALEILEIFISHVRFVCTLL